MIMLWGRGEPRTLVGCYHTPGAVLAFTLRSALSQLLISLVVGFYLEPVGGDHATDLVLCIQTYCHVRSWLPAPGERQEHWLWLAGGWRWLAGG
jgi:hypothetical protein